MATAARLPSQRRVLLLLLALLALVALLLHLGVGGTWLGPLDVIRELARGDTGEAANAVVWRIRLPRALACMLVGAMLSVVGASFQALFRNPLAEPYVVGVSSGASVGGVLAVVLGLDALWGGLGIMALGFVTGLGSLAVVFALARRRGMLDVQSLLLAGVVTGSMLAALTTVILFAAGMDTNRVLRWLMGSMSPMFWDRLGVMTVVAVVGSLLLAVQARKLNAFAMSESTAQTLGVNVGQLKAIVLITGTAIAAVCVGAVGIIGFVGLVAPHLARKVLGVDWRVSILGSIFMGAALLTFADILAQRAIPNTELPVGSVTAVLGAPFLLALLRKD